MTAIRAVPQDGNGNPFCRNSFATSDRMRWHGVSFPLTVDWLYNQTDASGAPILSAADKAKIRRVALTWARRQMEGWANPYNNPNTYALPVGTKGSNLLRQPQDSRRYHIRHSLNNYYVCQMRQLGMMAIAFDAADDVADPLWPGQYTKADPASGASISVPYTDSNGALRAHLDDAVEGWLYLTDHALRNEGRGGLPAEGVEYSVTGVGCIAQFVAALDTAGYADADGRTQYGDKVAGFSTNPFFRRVVDGFLHSMEPQAKFDPDRGQIYRPFWYGDGEHFVQEDPARYLGSMALHAYRKGDAAMLNAIRFIEREFPPGGASRFSNRIRDLLYLPQGILLFLSNDPNAAAPTDPRATAERSFYSPGIQRYLGRTDWTTTASAFEFKLGWATLGHQLSEGLSFGLYRNGEWLTKPILAYGPQNGGASEYKNSLAVQNTPRASFSSGPPSDADAFNVLRYRGSQMLVGRTAGDPPEPQISESAAYTYINADAKNLYNAYYDPLNGEPLAERALDVTAAARQVFWLKPDAAVIYDRAATGSSSRFKQFWLNLPDRLPATPQLSGRRVVSTTPGGQKLTVDSLLPSSATVSIVTADPLISQQRANLYVMSQEDPFVQCLMETRLDDPTRPICNPYATRMKVDATGGPSNVRFLHVLQGGSTTAPAVQSVTGGPSVSCAADVAAYYDGAVVGNTVALFNRSAYISNCMSYTVPASVQTHLIATGAPGRAFQVQRVIEGDQQRITLVKFTAGAPAQAPAGHFYADSAGVLAYTSGATTGTVGVPMMTVSTSPLVDREIINFGARAIATTTSVDLTFQNWGNGNFTLPSTVPSGSGAAQFAVDNRCPASGIVGPGSTCSIGFIYQPTCGGTHEARVSLNPDGTGTVPKEIILRGTADGALCP